MAPLVDWLGEWVLAVEQHHEKYDGTGYPRGLAGPEISQAAGIVAVTDVFDVITSARSYKPAVNGEAARKELIRSAGTHFDPVVVRAFMNVSMGKLRWVMGPLSWLADVPFIGGISRLARDAVMFGGTAVAIATLVFTGLITPHAVSVQAVAAEPAVTTTVDGPSTELPSPQRLLPVSLPARAPRSQRLQSQLSNRCWLWTTSPPPMRTQRCRST